MTFATYYMSLLRVKLVLLSVSRTGMQQRKSRREMFRDSLCIQSLKNRFNEQIITITFEHKSKVTTSISESFVKLECGIYLEINSNVRIMMLNKRYPCRSQLKPILLYLYLLCQSLTRMSDYISTGLQVNMHSVKVSTS